MDNLLNISLLYMIFFEFLLEFLSRKNQNFQLFSSYNSLNFIQFI
jgi:hypothetical protein